MSKKRNTWASVNATNLCRSGPTRNESQVKVIAPMNFLKFIYLLSLTWSLWPILALQAEASNAAITSTSNSVTPFGSHIAGELLVKFRGGPRSPGANLAHTRIGAKVLHTFEGIGWQRVELPSGMSVADGLAHYQALDTVVAAEPNHVIHRMGVKVEAPIEASGVTETVPDEVLTLPNDPKFTNQLSLQKISMPGAWSIATGSTNVVVAVIDSGVDYTHEDLAANMWRNPGETGLDENGNDKATNGIDDDGNGYVDDVYGIDAAYHDSDPMDDDVETDGHGTRCAGIIGAVGNNGIGIAGINWATQIMALKIFKSTGNSQTSWVLECYEYIIQMKKRGVNIRVTNNSYGDPSDEGFKDAIDAAGNLGILNVCAAGNDGGNNDSAGFYPAGYDSPSVLAVAAATASDKFGGNYGRKSVDLAAPSERCPTTRMHNSYASSHAGSSAAANHVAGAAALLLSVKPELSVAELKSALLGTVDLIPSMTNKVVANGRLNVARALQYLVDTNAPSMVMTAQPCGNGAPSSTGIELTFTKSMNHPSVESGFSLKPVATGKFEWSNQDRTVRFIPDAPLNVATYTGKLLGSAQDSSGVTLDGNYNRVAQGTNWDDFTWTFGVATDNDNFANAIVLVGNSGSVTGSVVNATKETGEPQHADKPGGASIWYRWTAASGDSITFDATATQWDTLLAVYSGKQLPALSPVVSNDNYGTLISSRVTFIPTIDSTYVIALDDRAYPKTGITILRWYPTPAPVFRKSSEFSPGITEWGTQVGLYGTNFTGVSSVLFGGVSAKFTNNSDLRITAIVPMGARNGPVTIQTPHGNVTSTSSFIALPKVFYTVSSADRALLVDWPGNGYVLEYTASLEQPIWQPVLPTPTAVESSNRTVLVLPSEGPGKFYRWKR
jgi:thermitase